MLSVSPMSSILSFVSSSSEKTGGQPPQIDVDRISLAASSQDDDSSDSDLFMSVQNSPGRTSPAGDSFITARSDADTRRDKDKSDSFSVGLESLLFSDGPAWAELQTKIVEKRKESSDDMMDMADLVVGMREELRWKNSVANDERLRAMIAELDPSFSPLEGTSSQFDSGVLHAPAVARVIVRSNRPGVEEVSVQRELDLSATELGRGALVSFGRLHPPRDLSTARWLEHAIENTSTLLTNGSPPSCLPRPFTKGDVLPIDDRTSISSFGKAPLRDAWVFQVHPNRSMRAILDSQRGMCAGCRMRIEGEYAKRVRYCDYFGAAFCVSCHDGGKGVVPAKLLQAWNFREFPLCDRAVLFLSQARTLPAFRISQVSPLLLDKIRALRSIIQLRGRLQHAEQYIKLCTQADRARFKSQSLPSLFAALPSHILEDEDLFSIADLEGVKSGELTTQLEELLKLARSHIEGCPECDQRSFMCWICRNEKDALFPFQIDRIHRCDDCGSLAHIKCYTKEQRNNSGIPPVCAKCTRIQTNRSRRRFVSTCDD